MVLRYIVVFITMKVSFKTHRRIIILVAVSQLFTTFCSTHLYPGSAFPNIQSQAERNMLEDFMVVGIEKILDTRNTSPDAIINTAQQYMGVPHCMGGTTMKCMDCSGLLVTVFATHDITLPHNSEEQARYGTIIAGMDELRKGDLVFFIRTYKTNSFITHSGIYIGNNYFIHTSSSKGVTIMSLNNSWWAEKFIFGTRVFH